MNRNQVEFRRGGGKAIIFEVEKPKAMPKPNVMPGQLSEEEATPLPDIQPSYKNNPLKNEGSGEYNKHSFERFYLTVKDDFKLTAFSVYYHISGSDYAYICGEKIISKFVADDFMAVSSTTVYINPNGVFNDRRYKSQYVTKIYDTKGGYYLIVLSSYSLETLSSPTGLTERICDYFSARMT